VLADLSEPGAEHGGEQQEEHAGEKVLTRRAVGNPWSPSRRASPWESAYLRASFPRESSL